MKTILLSLLLLAGCAVKRPIHVACYDCDGEESNPHTKIPYAFGDNRWSVRKHVVSSDCLGCKEPDTFTACMTKEKAQAFIDKEKAIAKDPKYVVFVYYDYKIEECPYKVE